jgi:GMP synthase (glutamine-hydrolysing)
MILFVDNEHASTFERPKTDWLLAWRARITYRLEDITGDTCLLQRYQHVDPSLIERQAIRAVFISGHGADPDRYDPADREGLRAIVRSGTTPVFGFCGGFQFIAESLGVTVDRVGPIPDDEEDPAPMYQPGWKKEVGYLPVRLVGQHPLHDGLGPAPVFRHAHTQELKSLPDGFERLAETDMTPIQLAAHAELPIAGSQFHPEYWTDEAPSGRRLIANFCSWTGIL